MAAVWLSQGMCVPRCLKEFLNGGWHQLCHIKAIHFLYHKEYFYLHEIMDYTNIMCMHSVSTGARPPKIHGIPKFFSTMIER